MIFIAPFNDSAKCPSVQTTTAIPTESSFCWRHPFVGDAPASIRWRGSPGKRAALYRPIRDWEVSSLSDYLFLTSNTGIEFWDFRMIFEGGLKKCAWEWTRRKSSQVKRDREIATLYKNSPRQIIFCRSIFWITDTLSNVFEERRSRWSHRTAHYWYFTCYYLYVGVAC
jgi:hypothetical protein